MTIRIPCPRPLRRGIPLVVVAVGFWLSLTGTALAANCGGGSGDAGTGEGWKVTDKRTHEQLAETNKTLDKIATELGCSDKDINQRLKDLYDQQSFNGAAKPPQYGASDSPTSPTPTEKLDDNTPTAVGSGGTGTTAQDVTVDDRCPDTSSSAGGTGTQQTAICKLIYQTQLAKYKYSLANYKNVTEKRLERLKAIEQERQNINDTDQGKLQDNTNKLMDLLAVMEVDKQQQKAYMDAYDARLAYLQAALDTVTSQALDGKKGGTLNPTQVVAGIIGGGVLEGALNVLKSSRRHPTASPQL